jgi:hypothetical protein
MNRVFDAVRRFSLLAEGEAAPQVQPIRSHWRVLLSSMLVLSYVGIILGQDAGWDVLNYHFYSGFALLHKPFGYDFAPAQVQTFNNPLLHVLSYVLLKHLPSMLAAAVLGAIQGLNFYLVFQISQILFLGWNGKLRFLISLSNAAAGFFGATGILELGTTYGDNMASLLMLTGLLLIFRFLLLRGFSWRGLFFQLGIAGILIGIGLGLKLTVSIYVVAISLSLTACVIASKDRLRPLVVFSGGLAAGFAASYGFWGIQLYREYQNPVFPYMNAFFKSPYYDLANTTDARFLPQTWLQTFFYPFFFARENHLVSEIDFRDLRLALCYIAIVLLVGAALIRIIRGRRFKRPEVRPPSSNLLGFLALFFVVSYVLWEQMFSIYRYLILLELLAPTFLALTLTYFFRRRSLVFAFSLFLNLVIFATLIPPDYGRQRFDDGLLKTGIPPVDNLDKSVVLMGGIDATSYIVPQFPASTRFVRITSNFTYPGRNSNMDLKIRRILEQYEPSRTLIYVAATAEMDAVRRAVSFYGVTLDDHSCRPMNSQSGKGGYLCGEVLPPKKEVVKQIAVPPSGPEFVEMAKVQIEVSPPVAIAGKDTMLFHIVGLEASAIDMLYTIDGVQMPPLRHWPLDASQNSRIPVDSSTKKGVYHIIGIRDSSAPGLDRWIKVDVLTKVK